MSRRSSKSEDGCHAGFDVTVKTAFVSSFTIDPLVDFSTIQAADADIGLDTYIAPYGQVTQEILNPESGLYAFTPDITFLIAEAHSLAHDPQVAANELIMLAETFKENTSGILALSTFIAAPNWPLHILPDEKQTQTKQANQRLIDHFADDPQIQICDIDSLAAYAGYANTFSPEMSAMAKIPFAESFMALLAEKIVSHLKVQTRKTRKCLVLDCDNTLWGGIIGEDGIDGIALGPDWPGREFVNFQRAILELFNQGVILAINSKNNQADVMQVLRDHPHMVLREEHFAAICANWDPKPQNMKALAQTINIGLDSLVFVDDTPAERQLMQQILPEVEILDLPPNPALYEQTLRQTNYFAKASLTQEDKQRGAIYAAQRKRVELEKTSLSLEDYLKSLEMTCTIRPAEVSDVKRVAQLTQRTNQFNLTMRRYSESDIQQMLESPDWNIYVLGLKDKFGDNGTVGLALVKTKAASGSDVMCDNDMTDNTEKTWHIGTFLMSCRVIGRQAEDALVDRICADARQAGIKRLVAEYIKAPKNNLVADFWSKHNFTQAKADESNVTYEFNVTDYKPKTFEYLIIE